MTITEEVLEIIREMPGVTSGNIIELMPHTNKQTIYATLNAQYIRGVVVRETEDGDGKGSPSFQWSMAPEGTTPPVVKTKVKPSDQPRWNSCTATYVPVPLGPTSQTIFDALNRDMEDLRRWKAEAIARYPDLGVDPIILKARNIVAEEMDGVDDDYAAAVRAGKRDGVLAMRLVVKMLEGGV